MNGAIAAGILKTIEDTLDTKTAEHFDLIVGTSTGGILALGLALGIPAMSLSDFYHSRGEKVFPSSAGGTWGCLRNLFRSKYSAEGLKTELQSVFQDRVLGDCRVPVVIPAYNLSENKVQMFKTRHHSRFEIDYKIAAWKVARATSAAPTFLPACREIAQAQLIDGGVFANNPIMVGVTEALGVFGVAASDIEILSIGTTKAVRRHCRQLDNAGVALWGPRIADLFSDAQASICMSQAMLLVGKEHILHIDPEVAEGEFRLDRYQPDRHQSLAADCARHNIPEIRRRFFSTPAVIGRNALQNPIGGLQHAA
jgi:patatin-like phospholipase/acyl hydrolase